MEREFTMSYYSPYLGKRRSIKGDYETVAEARADLTQLVHDTDPDARSLKLRYPKTGRGRIRASRNPVDIRNNTPWIPAKAVRFRNGKLDIKIR